MNQRKYIAALTMIVGLTGLSPMVAADAGRTSDGDRQQMARLQLERPQTYKLSPEQMDNVHAGAVNPWIVRLAAKGIILLADHVAKHRNARANDNGCVGNRC